MTSRYIPQLSFSFYRHRSIRADFSGGQITSDAGLLPLRAFDQRYGLTRGLAERVGDDRDDSRVSHPGLSLLRQRLYQIIAGYEDANDADRLRHDPAFQILADQPLGAPLGSQPTLSRWENSPSPRDLLKLQDALLDWFVKICGEQVRKRGEILDCLAASTTYLLHAQGGAISKNGSRGQKCGSAVPLRVHNRAPNLSSVTNLLSALRFWLLMN